MARAKKPVDIVFATQREFAAWLGVAIATVTSNWRPAGMPGDDGRWSVREIMQWLAESYGSKRASTPEAQEKRSAEARKLMADAGMKEFMLEKARGDYVSKTDVRLELAEFFIMFKDG